jgi:outer membrane protein TolC
MKIFSRSFVSLSIAAALFVAAGLSSGVAFAQGGPTTGGAQPTSQAAPLPLSGRAAQSGSVTTSQAPVAGTTTSVNTLNPTVQVAGAYAGSANSTAKMPFSGKLSFQEAVQRAISYNLGGIGSSLAARQAEGQARVSRSALLPNINGDIAETVEQVNLKTFGFRLSVPIPGFSIPSVVGPFNYIDFRASMTQNVADFTALNNYRSAKEVLRANQFAAQDARELVVLAAGAAYLQVIAAKARVVSAQAQLDTANHLYNETELQLQSGKVPPIDANQSQVQALTQQQRLVTLQNDVAKKKIALARLIGLPATDQYDITDDVPYSPAPVLSVDDALKQAYDRRADLKAADAQIRAAERTLAAARAERLPALSVNGDVGEIGTTPSQARTTYTAAATLKIPIWQGGRTAGDIEQADAALAQRRAELEDLKSQIEADVRNAYLDLQAATSQVELSQKNVDLSRDTLNQSKLRFEAGVTHNLEVVQSQESLASAEQDYVDAVFAHNIAKLDLARALGKAADGLPQFLKMQ